MIVNTYQGSWYQNQSLTKSDNVFYQMHLPTQISKYQALISTTNQCYYLVLLLSTTTCTWWHMRCAQKGSGQSNSQPIQIFTYTSNCYTVLIACLSPLVYTPKSFHQVKVNYTNEAFKQSTLNAVVGFNDFAISEP